MFQSSKILTSLMAILMSASADASVGVNFPMSRDERVVGVRSSPDNGSGMIREVYTIKNQRTGVVREVVEHTPADIVKRERQIENLRAAQAEFEKLGTKINIDSQGRVLDLWIPKSIRKQLESFDFDIKAAGYRELSRLVVQRNTHAEALTAIQADLVSEIRERINALEMIMQNDPARSILGADGQFNLSNESKSSYRPNPFRFDVVSDFIRRTNDRSRQIQNGSEPFFKGMHTFFIDGDPLVSKNPLVQVLAEDLVRSLSSAYIEIFRELFKNLGVRPQSLVNADSFLLPYYQRADEISQKFVNKQALNPAEKEYLKLVLRFNLVYQVSRSSRHGFDSKQVFSLVNREDMARQLTEHARSMSSTANWWEAESRARADQHRRSVGNRCADLFLL